MRKLWRSLRLWFATLPRIYWKRSRIKAQPAFAPVQPPAQVQNEVSERMQQVIDEAFEIALANNRESWSFKAPDGLPPRPARGDLSFNW